MKTRIASFCAVIAITALSSTSALAWGITEDRGTTVLITCADGSRATVGMVNDYWTVLSPGKDGKRGGKFSIVGKAALAACGE